MRTIQIRKLIEIHDGCCAVDPQRKGLAVTGRVFRDECRLTSFDKAATAVKEDIDRELAMHRAQLEDLIRREAETAALREENAEKEREQTESGEEE